MAKPNFTTEQKGNLFRALASKTLYDAGVELGVDKYFKDVKQVKGFVYRTYQQVLVEPEEYFIHPDTVELVKKGMASRAGGITSQYTSDSSLSLREKNEELMNMDLKDIILSNRKKAAILLSGKLDIMSKSKKILKDTSITALATAFGIMFDKGQIAKGEATEHIALKAKINKNMSSEEAISAILKMREVNQE